EGIRRTGAQSADYRRSGAGTALAHLRRLLPDSRLCRDCGFVPWRLALAHRSASQFHGRVALRRCGHPVVLALCLSAVGRGLRPATCPPKVRTCWAALTPA